MNSDNATPVSASLSTTTQQPTPLSWRLAIAAGVLFLGLAAILGRQLIGTRGQALAGIVCFLGMTAALSANLRAVNWRTIGMGILLQILLALFVLRFEIFGYRPGRELFEWMGQGVSKFLEFSGAGAEFVFGRLANPRDMDTALAPTLGPHRGFVFAFVALPIIIFVSSFFTILYHFGILQFIVRIMAKVMSFLMGTSGAETLSAAANVFLGQTEAPLIVQPYVRRMTRSELLALMAGGMATVSGGMMAVYITFGADPVAMLATGVMAAPCGLYLSKLLLPETEEPLTRGTVRIDVGQPYRNVIDAAAGGASEGLKLALNVAAMLIAFLALIALTDALLGLIAEDLSLKKIFSVLFWPFAVLIGVESADVPEVANLLGMKLAVNEMVAFGEMPKLIFASSTSVVLATFALTGFANFGSMGIQLGGIGAMAPERRSDLARLGLRAVFVGFLATMINAALAAILL